MSAFGAKFLVHPDLFPVRFSGEVHGDGVVAIDLPGGPYAVRNCSGSQLASLRERYADRLHDDSSEGTPLDVYAVPRADFREIDTRGWEYELELERTASSIAIAGMRLMARIERDPLRAALWTSVETVDEFWGVVENVLRPLLALRLLSGGGLLAHSAAVDLDGRAILFAGPSGSGKSTIAGSALAAGLPVLSDDMNAVVAEAGRYRLEPLPFTGDLTPAQVSRRPASLAAIVMLEKGDHESLRAMSAAQATSLLVRSAPYVNADRFREEQLMESAAHLARNVHRAVLTFRRDADVWPILRTLCN